MEYTCPHCETKVSPNKMINALIATECYGGGSFILICPKCEQKVWVNIVRTTELLAVAKADKDDELSYP